MSSSRFSFMTPTDLTSRPDMPMASAFVFWRLCDDVVDGLLDAEVEDGVAVVGEDDVDEVFADVVDVALDGGEDDLALGLALDLLHELFEVGDGGLHGLGGLEDEGELHLAGAEEFADDFHAVEEDVVDDFEGRVFLAGFVEVVDQVALLAVDDVVLELFFEREAVVVGWRCGGRGLCAVSGKRWTKWVRGSKPSRRRS